MSAADRTVVDQQLMEESHALRGELIDTGPEDRHQSVAYAEAIKTAEAKHEEEKRELVAEMKSALTFAVEERDAEIERLKSRLASSARLIADLFERLLAVFPGSETGGRTTVEKEEAAKRQRVCAVILRELYLQRPVDDRKFKVAGEGLFKLYGYVRNGTLNPVSVDKMLAAGGQLTQLHFNTEGGERRQYGDVFDIPRGDIVPFLRDIICHLSALEVLGLCQLPSLGECVLPVLDKLPPTLKELSFRHTPFNAADLVGIAQECQGLQRLYVDLSFCTDWGEFTAVRNTDLKKEAVNNACRGIVEWLEW